MIIKILFDLGCLMFGASGFAGMVNTVRGKQKFHMLDFGSLCFGLAATFDVIVMIADW